MLIFDLGERRHVLIDIYNKKTNKFEIKQATYELYDDTKQVEDSGACSIYEHRLDIVVEPKKIGNYKLKVTYLILDEILIENIRITVM